MTCSELVELVTDYLDSALSPAQHTEVAAHLEDCADCLRYLAQLQATRRVLAETAGPALSAQERAAAVRAFRAWCKSEHVRPRTGRPWWRSFW